MSVQGPNVLYDPGAAALQPPATPSRPAAAPASLSPAATATVSPWGELLGKLQRLKHDDRTAFAQTLSRMADTARSEAGKATGQTKEQYAKLADQLAQAARSGELSVFRPTKHHHARHLAPHAGSSVEPFLQVLLDQIDHVLGPDASPPQTTAP